MTATEPMTMDQMAESLLVPQEDEATEAPVEEQTEEVDQEEAVEAESEEEAEELDAAEADDDAVEDEDESEQEADEEPSTFTVSVDGEEREVTLDELTRGYAGQAYIQKGMTEAAALRKQTEETFNSLNQERQQLAALTQHLQQTGLSEPTAPDLALMESDPIAYMQQKAQYDHDKAQHDQTLQLVQQQTAQAQAAQAQAQAAFVQEQQAILAQKIPEFSDPEKGRAIQEKLVSTGLEYGFSKEDMTGITDARHVQVLHDAMRYREMLAKKGEVTAKAAKARPVVKAKAQKVQDPGKTARDKQRQRFKKTGRIEDAVDLMFDT